MSASEASAGLVSVLTTPTRVAAEGAALRAALGAFVVDQRAGMLARLRRAVGFAARAHAVSEKGSRSDVPWMLTLTYRDGSQWRADHVSRFIDALRVWCKRAGFACRYVWVAELQKRGAVHYHVVAWLPRGVRPPKPDVRGWWSHGMTQRIRCRHAVGYVMSYLKKGSHEGEFPKGSRRYGVGGLDHSLRRARRWLGLPAFVRARSSIADDWRRALGGGWIDPAGTHWVSEFQRSFVCDAWALVRVADHGRPFEADGPFNWWGAR